MVPEPGPDDERLAIERLHQIFPEASATRRQLMQVGMEAEPRSSLLGDDNATSPWRMSSAIWLLLQASLDHMHALDTTVRKGETFHLFAPYSLLRAALENAATVVWLLSPPARKERVKRRLVTMNAEIRNLDELRQLTEHEPTWPRRSQEIRAIAERQGLEPDAVLGKGPSVERIVREAALAAHGTDRFSVLCWKAWSGLAHGRESPAMAILNPEIIGELMPGRSLARIEASPVSVMLGASVAELMTARAWQLTDRSRRSPY